MALSRKSIQAARSCSGAESSRSSMSRSESALGTERGNLGVWISPTLALWASPRLSRKLKKERTDDNARAVGVEYRQGANQYRAHRHPETEYRPARLLRARREVILSGGTFNTPQLLMLSGIGPEVELKRVHVEPRPADQVVVGDQHAPDGTQERRVPDQPLEDVAGRVGDQLPGLDQDADHAGDQAAGAERDPTRPEEIGRAHV